MVKRSARKKQRTGKRAPRKYTSKVKNKSRRMKKKSTKRRLVGG